jgi:hypothetical protein
MKTARQLIKEYIDKGSNMPTEEMVLLTKIECEVLMEQYAQEVVKNNSSIARVSRQVCTIGGPCESRGENNECKATAYCGYKKHIFC